MFTCQYPFSEYCWVIITLLELLASSLRPDVHVLLLSEAESENSKGQSESEYVIEPSLCEAIAIRYD